MRVIKVGVLALGVLLLAGCEAIQGGTTVVDPNNENELVSYSLGASVATNVRASGLDNINADLVAQAIRDVYADRALQVDIDEAGMILDNYFSGLQSSTGLENAAEGEAFLAQNAQRESVVVLPSGLQYEVIEEGDGESPGLNDIVTVHYTGTLTDGTVFDSSVQRGEPAEFSLSGIIPGWQEALPLMKTGDTWKLFMPPELAYGAMGSGPMIGPNSTLIFEVELIGFESAGEGLL